MGAAEEMMLALDGPGVTPETVDSRLLLQLADAWLNLTAKVAVASKIGLSFTGLAVVKKCAAIATDVSDVGGARVAAVRALRFVCGEETPAPGTGEATERFRLLLRTVPSTNTVRLRLAGKWLPLKMPPTIEGPGAPWEMTELRVVPLRVGGKGPTVQLSCDGEDEPFTVEASLADARALGSLLQRAVDVTLTLRRDHAGRIDAGRILEVSPLDEGDPGDAWRRWFADDAAAWDEVDDIQAELGRA